MLDFRSLLWIWAWDLKSIQFSGSNTLHLFDQSSLITSSLRLYLHHYSADELRSAALTSYSVWSNGIPTSGVFILESTTRPMNTTQHGWINSTFTHDMSKLTLWWHGSELEHKFTWECTWERVWERLRKHAWLWIVKWSIWVSKFRMSYVFGFALWSNVRVVNKISLPLGRYISIGNILSDITMTILYCLSKVTGHFQR